MKKYDLITVGHMTVDLYLKGDGFTFSDGRFQLALGGKYFTDEFHMNLGGAAANVGIGAKKCGLKVGLVAKMGNNAFRKVIDRRLRHVGIPTDLCFFENDYTNVSVILTRGRGERTTINYEQQDATMIRKEADLKRFSKGRALFMGNLLDIKIPEREKVLAIAQDKGSLTALNLASKDCERPISELEGLLTKTDVLILNTHEFSQLVKKPYEKLDFGKNVVEGKRYLMDKVVILTDGPKGSYGYWEGNMYYMKAIEPAKVVDTTGAGDGYTAGFLASYIRHRSVPLAMKRGSYYAARKIAHLGAN